MPDKAKIQLFLVMHPDDAKWWMLDFVKNNPDDFYRVDILYFSAAKELNFDFAEGMKEYLSDRFKVHYCLNGSLEHHINKTFDRTCQFYLIVSDPTFELPPSFGDTLDRYVDKPGGYLMGIRGAGPEASYNGFLVNSVLHSAFFGFGEQSMPQKVDIDCINREYSKYVFSSIEDCYKWMKGFIGEY